MNVHLMEKNLTLTGLKKNIKIFVKILLIKKVLFQWSHLISNQSNKQQTNKTLYLHILNLNTVALQISKETLFDVGISNRIKNNEN